MLKVIGVVCLVLGGTLAGMGRAAALRERARVLRDVQSALWVMQGEICTYNSGLPELFERLAGAGDRAAPLFLRLKRDISTLGDVKFEEIWRKTVEQAAFLKLEPQERECLARLGSVLGRYDAEEQQRCLAGCGERFGEFAAAAEREAAARGGMWTGLGTAAGTLLAVILL